MKTYEALGATVEEAVTNAHDQIPSRIGRDFTVSKVVSWGMQTGGFVATRQFYAVIEEDVNAPFRTKGGSGKGPS